MTQQRVAVIYGGRSGEHEVSLRSAKAVMDALPAELYKVLPYFISPEGRWSPKPIQPEPGANAEIDVVFPVLHGTFGEDGTMQGLLELADLPYVGPGVLASSACMDKEVTKRLCEQSGLPVVEYEVVYSGNVEWERLEQRLGYPMFVKPANLGSSVGISKAKTREEVHAAIELACRYDHKVIVERSIVGHELECAVLGNQEPEATLPCEILPSKEFYDYEDKYLLDKAQVRMPANLPPEMLQRVRELAVACFKAMGCEGLSRVDFLVEKATGSIYINEPNTIPGFTSISMYPKMWEHMGLPFPALVERLLALAVERHEGKKALRFTR